VTDADNNDFFVGYGTWAFVDEMGGRPVPKHVEIAWFGISTEYQGKVDDNGASVAGRVYRVVEDAARAHPDFAEDMPFTLQCHVENGHARGFWESRGYRLLPDPKVVIEDDVYHRMVR
jgi:hypothetical protein